MSGPGGSLPKGGSLPEAGGLPEEDLHAYVDNQLDPDRRAEVARWLAEHPEASEKVAAYREQREALRAALADRQFGDGQSGDGQSGDGQSGDGQSGDSQSGDSPSRDGQSGDIQPGALPPRLDLQRLISDRLAQRRTVWRSAAAVLLAFGVGGIGGWFLHPELAPSPSTVTVLVREALANHVVYTADRRRPTELGAEQRDDLARWVSNRLNRQVAPPDLSTAGFLYMGGRLAATPEGPAGMFMYQNDKAVRLTVFVRPIAGVRNVPISRVGDASLGGCAWIEKGVGYTVVAPVPEDELERIAHQVQRAVDAAT